MTSFRNVVRRCAWETGNSLKVKVAADGGKETTLALSLKGFPSALDRTTARLQ